MSYLVFHAAARNAVEDSLNQPDDLFVHFCQFRFSLCDARIGFDSDGIAVTGVFVAEDFHQFRVHQMVL
ncbi:hypothetical protein [Aliiroseovarius sediminilitoris]|uniref:hypothetical protein n=1 Tax=Aliiroseovarius sediminilitoris TaxID=1173584 RepID=UPI001FE00413|nr:hypothetical protein [Aliiroseovarius sediminilitoris]